MKQIISWMLYLTKKTRLMKNHLDFHSDTHGQKEMLFGFTELLNIKLMPYWNTQKIRDSVQRLREKGENIKDYDIKFITPLITRHINRHGKFSFDLEKRKIQIK